MAAHIALAGLLTALAVGALCCALLPRAFGHLTSWLVVAVVMWPRLFELAVPPRFALAVLLALGVISCTLCMSATVARRTLVAVIVLGFTGIMLVAFLGFQVATAGVGDSYFRYLAVAPLAAVYGYLLVRSGRIAQMGYALLTVAVISAVLAIVEYSTSRPILEGNPFDEFRNGQYRAAVFSDQTLVLSAMFLCALAVAVIATRGAIRIIAVAVLFAGIATTWSRGALVLAAGYVIVATVWGAVPGLRRYGAIVKACSVGILVVTVPLLYLFQPAVLHGVTSSDPTVASAQYRGAIYAVTVEALRSHPFGWGPSGPPKGLYTLRSPFGTLDISDTVDSELVHSALEFGYLGVAALAVLAVVVIRRLRADRWWSQVAVLITAAGVYLSIHSWLSLLTLWALVIGAAVANPQPKADVTQTDSMTAGERIPVRS